MTEGRILLADRHQLTQDDQIQITGVIDPTAQLNQLNLFQYINLAGGQTYAFQTGIQCCYLLIPITGAVAVEDIDVDVEQSYLFSASTNETVSIQNLFEEETISFILIGFVSIESIFENRILEFSADIRNKIQGINGDIENPKVGIGFFDGRAEAVLNPEKPIDFFAFVISGAFELSGRLLHQFDGLLLSDASEIDMEALSENAAILIIEQVKS